MWQTGALVKKKLRDSANCRQVVFVAVIVVAAAAAVVVPPGLEARQPASDYASG